MKKGDSHYCRCHDYSMTPCRLCRGMRCKEWDAKWEDEYIEAVKEEMGMSPYERFKRFFLGDWNDPDYYDKQ